MLRRLGLTIQAAPSPAQPVAPLSIRDKKRFAQIDALIAANWGEVPQDKIPDEVMIAAEEGKPVPRRRPPSEENPFAAPAKPKKPPRQMTPERIERRRYLAKQRYDFRFPGRKESK